MADLIKGIDVSVIQGVVDFKAVAATGVQFVVCRCGVGNSGKDTTYDANVKAVMAAGLKVMAYHFVYPLPTTAAQPLRDPTAQAKLHASYCNGALAACDLEWPTSADWAKWGCTAEQIAQWTVTYLAAYEAATGVKPLVYTYPDFAQSVKLPASVANYPLWIASYDDAKPLIPAPWTDWVMWQNTGGGGKLPNGAPVDTDVVRDLSLWNVAAPVAPIPEPVITPIQVDTTPVVVVPPAPVPVAAPVAPISKSNIFTLIYQIVSGLLRKFGK